MKKKTNTEAVESYYDKMTSSYLETYGNTIQAFRPTKEDELLDYIIEGAGIEEGMNILDAGCGVAGPAVHFAKRKDVNIHGVTISQVQIDQGTNAICQESLQGKVTLTKGDFHQLTDHFEPESFDLILFLESLGHSHDPQKVLSDCYGMLKKGGHIYIKDFYPLEIPDKSLDARNQLIIDKINNAYNYNVLDLNTTISQLRQCGFEIDFIKRFDFDDDIEARAAFETINKIDLYDGQDEFQIAEWLEIKCQRPEFPLF